MRKTFRIIALMAASYLLCQVLLILLVWVVFEINLFDSSTSERAIADLDDGGLKLIISFNQFFGLFLPAFIFLIVQYGKILREQIALHWVARYEIYLLAILALIFSFPVIQLLAEINTYIPVADWLESTSNEISQYMIRIIKMESTTDLILNLLLIGLLPALAEELFFRGMLQNELVRFLKNYHAGIWFTAIVFSAFHFQFEGFLPRLYLGALLGYTYHYSRSFIIPILLHFTNNSILVMANYWSPQDFDQQSIEAADINYTFALVSVVIVIFTIWSIKKITRDEK
jgi:membrane protease YdiL (CAAX protease family)